MWPLFSQPFTCCTARIKTREPARATWRYRLSFFSSFSFFKYRRVKWLIPSFGAGKRPMKLNVFRSGRNGLRFPVGEALEDGYQLALVVFHLNSVGAELEVLGNFAGVGPECAGGAGFHEGDAHVDGHDDVAVRI